MKISNIKKIIQEEIQSIVKSELSSPLQRKNKPVIENSSRENEFTAKIQLEDMDRESMVFYGLAKTIQDAEYVHISKNTAEITIKWYADFEYRSYGIKSIYPVVPDQTISFYYEVDDENGDYRTEHAEISIKNIKTKLNIPEDFYGGISLAPSSIEFYNKNPMVLFELSV